MSAKSHAVELFRASVFLFGLSVCILGTWLAWPGYTVDGHSYSYPVSGAFLAMIASGWLVVLGLTFLALKKMRSK